ncbi:DUF3108 domain-containing protein [Tahibacter amnicola]|uniref:DUF3108 domain-containing protein n=1 Tax=Tahibacter amnicola TaxID=2976241 RepID=A0ABY6BEF9_9GAMM|nr:DUF3108 domain-containing protein [Tahibacter amnicola]UXI67490.1 DUF3108 domain-containing protein [Tahibacter amnicola]
MTRAVLAAVTLAAFALGAHAAPPSAFMATYTVSRDGKTIGSTTMTLKAGTGDAWSLTTQTKGTAGLARLMGLEVMEESRFRWQGSAAQGVAYDYRQDAAIRKKKRRIDFDWSANEARVVDNDELFRYAIKPGTIDRHTVGVALALQLPSADGETILPVATKDHLEMQRFKREGEENLTVPAGRFQTTRIGRTDVQGKGRSWYAPEATLAPIKIEQKQGDGALIVMELASVTPAASQVAAAGGAE